MSKLKVNKRVNKIKSRLRTKKVNAAICWNLGAEIDSVCFKIKNICRAHAAY